MIFNLRESKVPSFIRDSKTSSGLITEEDEAILVHKQNLQNQKQQFNISLCFLYEWIKDKKDAALENARNPINYDIKRTVWEIITFADSFVDESKVPDSPCLLNWGNGDCQPSRVFIMVGFIPNDVV